jgi:hypothetical protein
LTFDLAEFMIRNMSSDLPQISIVRASVKETSIPQIIENKAIEEFEHYNFMIARVLNCIDLELKKKISDIQLRHIYSYFLLIEKFYRSYSYAASELSLFKLYKQIQGKRYNILKSSENLEYSEQADVMFAFDELLIKLNKIRQRKAHSI